MQSSSRATRPLSRIERESVQPDNLARILHSAVRRLSYVEPTNVADVASQLNQFAMRLDRLAAERAEYPTLPATGLSTIPS